MIANAFLNLIVPVSTCQVLRGERPVDSVKLAEVSSDDSRQPNGRTYVE